MGDRSWEHLSFPLTHANTELEHVIKKEASFNPNFSYDVIDGVVTASVNSDSSLAAAKDRLKKLNIPYDYAVEFYDSDSLVYKFRPEVSHNDIAVDGNPTHENKPYIFTSQLRNLFGYDPKIAMQKLMEMLDEADPQIPELSDYAS